MFAQSDYSALKARLSRIGGFATAVQGPVELTFGVYTYHQSTVQQRQLTAATNIQRVFRGWRHRVVERVNALKYDLERRRQRAVVKAWKRARQLVADEVSGGSPMNGGHCFMDSGMLLQK